MRNLPLRFTYVSHAQRSAGSNRHPIKLKTGDVLARGQPAAGLRWRAMLTRVDLRLPFAVDGIHARRRRCSRAAEAGDADEPRHTAPRAASDGAPAAAATAVAGAARDPAAGAAAGVHGRRSGSRQGHPALVGRAAAQRRRAGRLVLGGPVEGAERHPGADARDRRRRPALQRLALVRIDAHLRTRRPQRLHDRRLQAHAPAWRGLRHRHGQHARAAIRVRKGKIAEWYRLPDDPNAPLPPPEAPQPEPQPPAGPII